MRFSAMSRGATLHPDRNLAVSPPCRHGVRLREAPVPPGTRRHCSHPSPFSGRALPATLLRVGKHGGVRTFLPPIQKTGGRLPYSDIHTILPRKEKNNTPTPSCSSAVRYVSVASSTSLYMLRSMLHWFLGMRDIVPIYLDFLLDFCSMPDIMHICSISDSLLRIAIKDRERKLSASCANKVGCSNSVFTPLPTK